MPYLVLICLNASAMPRSYNGRVLLSIASPAINTISGGLLIYQLNPFFKLVSPYAVSQMKVANCHNLQRAFRAHFFIDDKG